MSESKFKYAYWNMNKDAEPGYSRELISYDMPEDINTTQYPGIDTVIKAIDRTAERIPNNNCFGTRNKESGEYEWMTFREVRETAVHIAHGVEALGLAPTV